jgi:hypothetical protein
VPQFSVTAFSTDGRYIVFQSYATNLGGSGMGLHAFVRDRLMGTTALVSDAPAGYASISGDGRYVVYLENPDVPERFFKLLDRQSGLRRNIAAGLHAVISADGGRVAFDSDATDLVPDDTNGRLDTFTYDVATALIQRVSVTSAGVQAMNQSAFPAISADGRFVQFGGNGFLAPGDHNHAPDAYLHELTAAPPPPFTALRVTPLELSYANQKRGTTSAAKPVTVTNTTAATVAITDIRIAGANPNQFSQVSNCGASVAGGASCTINVRFMPGSAGVKQAVLNVNGGGNGLRAVQLSGTGVR